MKLNYKAVHREELQQFLKNIGLLTELEKGTLECANCGKTLTSGNIGTITRYQGKLMIFCDSSECVLPKSESNAKAEDQ